VRLGFVVLNVSEQKFKDTAKSTRIFLLFGGISKEIMEIL